MQSHKPSVAAIVVTFNRKLLLLECLEALLAQTCPLGSIIIIDNASTDGTYEMLKSQGMLEHPSIDYLRLPENTGGAGGFFQGVKRGYEQRFDWLWLMDDDVEPARDCLEQMFMAYAKFPHSCHVSTLIPLRLNPAGTGLDGKYRFVNHTSPLQQIIWHTHPGFTTGDLLQNFIKVGSFSFEGPLIPRHSVEKAGFPDPRFFICFDDLEYASRLKKIGDFFLIPSAHLKKKFIPSKKAIQGLDWKRYYAVRNRTYIFRQIGPAWAKMIDPMIFALEVLAGVIRHRLGWRNARLILQAFWDGWQGRLGKTIDPANLQLYHTKRTR